MNLNENFNQLKKEAYTGLQKRSSSKKWILMLESMPYYLCSMTRGRLLQAVNVGMRLLDDIADGDRPAPIGTTPVSYLENKQAFINNPTQPVDELDYLFTYCYKLAQKARLPINRELNSFFEYFLFDAKRRGTDEIFSQAELDQAYDACDITGTIRGSLMVFGDNADRAELLAPVGKATRKYYTLRDYESDITAGFVNISAEAMKTYGITTNDLSDRTALPVNAWFHNEAKTGLALLDEQDKILKTEKFGFRGKIALKYAYMNPTRAYLEAVLQNKNIEPN